MRIHGCLQAAYKKTKTREQALLSPTAADKQPATPNVAGARGHTRETSSSADSAAGRSFMGVEPEIEVAYSGELESPSESKSPAKPGRKALGVETTAAKPRGSLDKFQRHAMPTILRTRRRYRADRIRIHMIRVKYMKMLVIGMMPMNI